MSTPPPRRGVVALAAGLVVTALLSGTAALIVVPPRSMAMLVGTVAATEYSPLLALLCFTSLLVVRRLLGAHRRARIASTVLLSLAGAVACWPLARFGDIAETAREQMGAEVAARYAPFAALRAPAGAGAVREREVPYRAADGSPLSMRLMRGPLAGARPTVVVLYGGAWRGGTTAQGASVSRALAAQGFTVASIAYRHAPRARHPAQLADVHQALALLRDSAAAWQVDTSRIALLGRSAGGHLAELAAWTPGAPRVQAVVALYAPFDLVQGYVDVPDPDPIGVRAVLRDLLGGTPAEQPARYRDASPSRWVRPGLPPVLLVYGARDHVVKPAFNRAAAARLRAADVPVIAVEIPWAEHGFDMAPGGLGAQLAMHTIAAFLERALR